MSKVFISYRRSDSRYQARRIYDALKDVLPRESIFMDIDSIRPGQNFRTVLQGWVERCDVMLALMTESWGDVRDPRTGKRRLADPNDFVRIEIAAALARGIPVVPVLLDGAGLPARTSLPKDLKELVDRQAEHIEFRTFDADVRKLVAGLRLAETTAAPEAGLQVGAQPQPYSKPATIPISKNLPIMAPSSARHETSSPPALAGHATPAATPQPARIDLPVNATSQQEPIATKLLPPTVTAPRSPAGGHDAEFRRLLSDMKAPLAADDVEGEAPETSEEPITPNKAVSIVSRPVSALASAVQAAAVEKDSANAPNVGAKSRGDAMPRDTSEHLFDRANWIPLAYALFSPPYYFISSEYFDELAQLLAIDWKAVAVVATFAYWALGFGLAFRQKKLSSTGLSLYWLGALLGLNLIEFIFQTGGVVEYTMAALITFVSAALLGWNRILSSTAIALLWIGCLAWFSSLLIIFSVQNRFYVFGYYNPKDDSITFGILLAAIAALGSGWYLIATRPKPISIDAYLLYALGGIAGAWACFFPSMAFAIDLREVPSDVSTAKFLADAWAPFSPQWLAAATVSLLIASTWLVVVWRAYCKDRDADVGK